MVALLKALALIDDRRLKDGVKFGADSFAIAI
jgi:hypothetical protein